VGRGFNSLLRHHLFNDLALVDMRLGNKLGNMSRYTGKICAQHPELDGERRNGNCPACQRARVRPKPSRDVQRRKVKRWRAANRSKYLAGAHARVAARRSQWEGDSPDVRRAFAAMSRKAKRLGMVIDHVVPLKPCRVCGETGEHVPSNWQLLTLSQNSSKGNRCQHCWVV
jgi:hypothetical protein